MSKRVSIIIALCLAAGGASSLAAAVDVHAVIETTRTYRGASRASTQDLWIGADRQTAGTDAFLFIIRKDLGLVWSVSRRPLIYNEDKRAPAPAPAKTPREDIHTAGFDYGQGPMTWTLEPLAGTKTINGVVCDHFMGRGRSDVGEISVDLWAAPAATPGGPELLKSMIESLRDDSRRSEIAGLLDKLGGRVPLERDEVIDGPIGPVMTYAIKVLKLEKAEPPAGTYDLPAGAKKETAETPSASRPDKPAFELPAAVTVELLRLGETYRVLDAAAAKVWTGWSDYREHVFLFTFENGLKVLVGHPNPPKGFERLAGAAAGGRDVYIDKSRMSALEIRQPLSCGGGIGALGEVGGRPVTVIDMKFAKVPDDPSLKDKPFRAEQTILVLVHELFHLFQSDAVLMAYGNLSYNADANYALYSAVEGLALAAAYREADSAKARESLKDFLLARELKRKSMTDQQAKEESSDDVREGTAVYSEVRTLEALREGFKAGLSQAEDPFYGGFRDIDGLLQTYLDRLKASAEDIFDVKGKCYTYGSFQALLLQRHFPGWQEPFAKEARRLDEELGKRVPLTKEDGAGAAKRFQALYGLAAIKAKTDKAMADRAAAFKAASGAKGLTFAISFKEIGQFVESLTERKKAFSLGLISVYPDGVGSLAFDDVSIDIRAKPVRIEKLYHLIVIDPDAGKRAKPYEIAFEKKEGEDTFINAVVTTPLFTLKAPKLKIAADPGRVKIWILARVKD
ncbi:MAG: hypothetical protein PHI34_01410 [Acidobacteriota bacterium]|nr:hypothetical protein [Acidobacteriota bacterium]